MTTPEIHSKIAHEKWVRKDKVNLSITVGMAWLAWNFPDYNMKFDYEKR